LMGLRGITMACHTDEIIDRTVGGFAAALDLLASDGLLESR
jgi:hypothetical protein